MITRTIQLVVSLCALLLGCDSERLQRDRAPTPSGGSFDVRTSLIAAGEPEARLPRINPYDGDAAALREGGRFYSWFNCAACHGEIGGGGMGPPLRDGDWIYGGAPENIHQSIVQGRPDGMPAFGRTIPDDSLWKLVAFVSSLTVTTSESDGAGGGAESADAQD